MLKKHYTYFLVLPLLMYFNISKGQVYAPDTTFKLNFTPENGAKINFLHKINDNSFYVGTSIYADVYKPYVTNLYIFDLNGQKIKTIEGFNSKIIATNKEQILIANTNGTQIYEKGEYKFIDKRTAIDINWNTNELLIDDNYEVKIIDLEGNEKDGLNKFYVNGGSNNIYKTIFYDNKSIATYEQNKLQLFDFNGKALTVPKEYQLSFYSSSIGVMELFKINDKLLGINAFNPYFQYYQSIASVLDSTGKILQDNSKKFYTKFIGTQQTNLIQRTQSTSISGSVYIFYDKNLVAIKNKTLFGERYLNVLSFDDIFIANDYQHIVKLSTKNSKYIEAIFPDTVEINSKPIKVLTKTIGSNEKINISCDCGLIKNDTLFPQKSGNFIISFKTNSGLILNKNLIIKKRKDSISFTGFRDLSITELPVRFSTKSKSGLPVKHTLEYNGQLVLRNDEIINRGLPSSYNKSQSQYVIYVETQGNEEFESIRQKLVFKIKGINDLISLENQTNKFILYPNPVSENNFKVLYTGTEFISNPNFKLNNNLGKEIEISQIISGNDYIYQLTPQAKISTGIYFLRISYYSFETGEDENEVRRIIIK